MGTIKIVRGQNEPLLKKKKEMKRALNFHFYVENVTEKVPKAKNRVLKMKKIIQTINLKNEGSSIKAIEFFRILKSIEFLISSPKHKIRKIKSLI